MTEWALLGGAGFIGQHLAHSILDRKPYDRVAILDIVPLERVTWRHGLAQYLRDERLQFRHGDVRREIAPQMDGNSFDVIVNLAAIHREPGHTPEEYFATNVGGAENACAFADGIGCREIIFTSSIAVYGIHDRQVDEAARVAPRTAYGQSKLKAEELHACWAKQAGGRLVIVRPGVVFGPGEGGNVSRLLTEMLKRNRAIRLEPDQPKAGIYIEELLNLVHWLRSCKLGHGEVKLVNGVSHENLSFNAFGRALQALGELQGQPYTVSSGLLKSVIRLLGPLRLVMPASARFHPDRLVKLTRANDIRSTVLGQDGYEFAWTLERSLQDWLRRGI